MTDDDDATSDADDWRNDIRRGGEVGGHPMRGAREATEPGEGGGKGVERTTTPTT